MTEEKKSMVPKLRFPGFNETWEQRKLGDFAEKVTEKNTELRYSEVFTNSAEFGVIRQRDFFDHDIAQLRSLHGYYVVKEDDFVYNPRISVTAPVGPINRNKLGKTGVVSPLYTVLRTQGINREFLEWFFKSSCWYPFMLFNGDSGARSDRFSIKNALFFRMPIALPCQAEQMKIGLFFERLDKAITLHQRKLEGLSKLKKSLLQKMFPKNGQQNPEVRFPGFTEAWEQRELCEVAKVTMGQSPRGENYTSDPNDKILIQGNADLRNGWVCPRVWTKEVTKTCNKGDIIFSVRAPVGDVGKTAYDAVIGRGVASIKGSDFVFQTLQYLKQKGYWTKVSAGSTFDSVNSDTLRKTLIQIPIDPQEQAKIGEFFSSLDGAITLHQRKLESLKILKKSLLQQMFV